MQTWAKRGMQAALVTGGMLAAGTGAASASEDCPERPTSPLGGSKLTPLEALGDGTPRSSGLCYSGELFPEEIGSVPTDGGRHSKTVLSGTIDPVRDLLPAVEDALTQEIPRIRDDGAALTGERSATTQADTAGDRLWIPPEEVDRVADSMRTLELAGWVADTPHQDGATTGDTGTSAPVPGHPSAAMGVLSKDDVRGRHAAQRQFGTPADGYHRSLRWSGPIGGIVDRAVEASDGLLMSTQRDTLPPPLVRPEVDPAVVDGFDRAESLTSLWESARGRGAATPVSDGPAALLSTRAIDLTSGVLGGGPTFHTLPGDVLTSAMSVSARPVETAGQEFVPLQVPGEHQEKAHEVPNLDGVGAATSARTGAASPSGGRGTGVVLPLPGAGEMHALDGGEIGVPRVNRIADALDGNRHTPDPRGSAPQEPVPGFATEPHRLDVAMTVVDELSAAVPERDVVTRNPFREATAARSAPAGGMALPVLGGGIPDITAVQDQTLPLPAVDADGTPKLTAEDTAAMLRGVARQI